MIFLKIFKVTSMLVTQKNTPYILTRLINFFKITKKKSGNNYEDV